MAVKSRLRRAIRKARFFITFDLRRWLLSCAGEELCSSSRVMTRTISGSLASDDIDKRSEDFIERFHRRLKMERQISLPIGYCWKHETDNT